jgi:hypothetical protein
MTTAHARGRPRLPDFIVVGPPRTATTWLDDVLRGRVGLPAGVKETHFFARNYGQGIDWYARHFEGCDPARKVGEICAAYFENPEARDRIHAHIPDCRIVCTLRDPIERLHSYYKLLRQGGKTDLSFELAVRAHPKMLEFSRYATLLRAWRARFGEANVLAVLNDDLAADPRAYVDRITDFIGAEPVTLPASTVNANRRNAIETAPRHAALARNARRLRSWMGANGYYRARSLLGRGGLWRFCSEGGAPFPPVEPTTRAWLLSQLKSEIEQLETLLGRELPRWKSEAPTVPSNGHSSTPRVTPHIRAAAP